MKPAAIMTAAPPCMCVKKHMHAARRRGCTTAQLHKYIILVLDLVQYARSYGVVHVTEPASAPPRTCRTAPTVLLRVEDMPRTSLSAGRRRATLIRQAAPSPRAKAAIGWRGAVAVVWHTVWAAPMHGSP